MRLQLRSSLVKPAKKVIGKQRLTVLVNVSFPAPISLAEILKFRMCVFLFCTLDLVYSFPCNKFIRLILNN